jgi:hypothetical protein
MRVTLREAFALAFFAYWVYRAARFAWVHRYLRILFGERNRELQALAMRESPMMRRILGDHRT